MISLQLLRQTGNVEALINLTEEDNLTVGELSDVMGLHESTVRMRMNELDDADLVSTEADMVDGRAVRTWSATKDGEQLATSLASLVSDYSAGDSSPAASSEAQGSEGTASDD